MNITLFCKRYYTNKDLISDQYGRLYHFPKEWVKMGHHVTVIAFNYRTDDEINIRLDGVYFYSIPVSIKSLLTIYPKVKRIVNSRQTDVILSSADPIIGMVGLMVSSITHNPFIFDVYDDYGAFGISRIPGMQTLFEAVIKRADLISCVSKSLRHHFTKLNHNIGIFPNGTDPSMFFPLSKKIARNKLHLPEDSVYIGYTGSIDQRFDYHTLIKAFKKIKTEFPNAILLIAGKNLSCMDLNDTSIRYLGELDQKEVPIVISASDVMVLPYSSHHLAKTCNPCKLTEYLACERPVVAAKVSDIADYFPNTTQSLYLCGSEEDLAEKLLLQIKSPEFGEIRKEYLWENIAGDLMENIRDLVK
jgi:glycosyltransferase involved in cell wall biosynthesis